MIPLTMPPFKIFNVGVWFLNVVVQFSNVAVQFLNLVMQYLNVAVQFLNDSFSLKLVAFFSHGPYSIQCSHSYGFVHTSTDFF